MKLSDKSNTTGLHGTGSTVGGKVTKFGFLRSMSSRDSPWPCDFLAAAAVLTGAAASWELDAENPEALTNDL